jgi:hypothetical protein
MTKVMEKDYDITPSQTELLIRPIRLEKKFKNILVSQGELSVYYKAQEIYTAWRNRKD